MKGLITNIQRFSLHDGPGIRTTIFFQGCPLSCIWCHNPETISDHKCIIYDRKKCIDCNNCIDACAERCFSNTSNSRFNSKNCNQCGECIDICETGALYWSSRWYDLELILNIVEKDRVYYSQSNGGITLSGGEPFAQFEFCYDLSKALKGKGFHVAMDTSGYVSWRLIEKILPFVDLFLFDLKVFDEANHKKLTGKSNRLIIENFNKLCTTSSKKITVRVPMIADCFDSEENIQKIKNLVLNSSSGVKIEFIPHNKFHKEKYRMIGKSL